MARKTKQLPQNRVTTATRTNTRSDEDILEKLCHLVLNHPTKMRGANGVVLAKSWKISPKRCNNIEKPSFMPQFRDNTKDTKVYEKYVPRCWYYGRQGSDLPPWEMNTPFKYKEFSKVNNNFVTVGVTGVSRPLFMFYKQTSPWYTWCCLGRRRYEARHDTNAHKWVKYDCVIIDPNSSSRQHMQLVNIVAVDGKFYALSSLGTLVIIEEVDSSMIITRVSSSRAVPSVPSKYFREYLVESDGDIWRIFLLHSKSTSVVDDVEIFQLQMENIAWKKVEKLGKDRAVFAGTNHCCVATASEVECKANCIYITNHVVDGWRVYDVARGKISLCSKEQ